MKLFMCALLIHLAASAPAEDAKRDKRGLLGAHSLGYGSYLGNSGHDWEPSLHSSPLYAPSYYHSPSWGNTYQSTSYGSSISHPRQYNSLHSSSWDDSSLYRSSHLPSLYSHGPSLYSGQSIHDIHSPIVHSVAVPKIVSVPKVVNVQKVVSVPKLVNVQKVVNVNKVVAEPSVVLDDHIGHSALGLSADPWAASRYAYSW